MAETMRAGVITRRGLLRLSAGVSVLAFLPAAARIPTIYKDPRAPVDLRVRDLLARMTLDEKVAQLIALWGTKADVMVANGLEFDAAKAAAAYPNGIGQVTRPSDRRGGPEVPAAAGGTAARWRGAASTIAFVNAVQRWARDDTRLGVPVLFHEESLHGYMAPGATMFPQAIAMAGSFDPDLMRRVQAVIGREVHAHGSRLALSPASTSRATRAGAESRRRSARIRSSAARWGSPRSAACRATAPRSRPARCSRR